MFAELLRNSIFYLEIICAIAATVTFKFYKNSPSRYFLFFLWFVVLIELLGEVQFYYVNHPNDRLISFLKTFIPENLLAHNLWLYNIYNIITYSFYLFFYYKLSSILKNKQIIKYLFIFFLITCISASYYYQDVFGTTYLKEIYISGALIFLLAAIMYLQEIFKSNKILIFHKTLPFWITFGALIFHLGITPIIIFSSQLNFSHQSYNYILSITNYIMYVSFIIGFVINAIKKSED